MDARSKRREATRRTLERQLQERQVREARRKRITLISSIGGTVVLIAAVIVLVVALNGGSGSTKKSTSAAGANASSATSAAASSAAASSAAPSSAAPAAPTTPCAKPDGKSTATFQGVTVGQATNLKHEPKVTSSSTKVPTTLSCMDLVVGKGAAATPTSNVTVQYTGVLYKNGKQFDSSWARGQAAPFSLTQVVPGFTQGIGGAGKVAPMHVGGRRIIIMPPSLGYGSQANASIPANSPLVFVVDLVKVG